MGLEDESQKVFSAAPAMETRPDAPGAVNTQAHKLEEDFQKAVEEAKDIPDSIDYMDKLTLYGLYKSATIGKCNVADPGVLNITDNAKYRAWKMFEGKTKEESKADYIIKIAQIRDDL